MHKYPVLATAAAFLVALAVSPAPAAPADRFIHVQVSESNKNGTGVNVNVPLAMAEKVLPTIDKGPLHQGRVTIPNDALQGIDLRSMLDAVRTSPDSNFVTAKDGTQNISVEKSKGNIIVHVKDSKPKGDNVDVTVPLSVVDALFSNVKSDELDVAAALQELDKVGDTLAVTVQSGTDHVRVWIDSNSAQ
jgi:hypothetical protein